ncbi:MAG: hypothetical protein V3V62_15505 [bacterium]
MSLPILLLFALLGAVTFADAAPRKSPYAGQEKQRVKALSPAEIKGLLEGKGLGFAKAAELNHFPGPSHVIENAPEIQLTADQLARTKTMFLDMKKEAVSLGRDIIRKETKLDALFAGGLITEAALRRTVGEIAHLRGALRATHLRYHLKMKKLLSPHQIALYDRARGYTGDSSMSHGSMMHDSTKK